MPKPSRGQVLQNALRLKSSARSWLRQADPLTSHSTRSGWMIPFSLRTHTRNLVMIGGTTVLCGLALTWVCEHLLGQRLVVQARVVNPTTLLPHKSAAFKEARLLPDQVQRIAKRLEIAETNDDGDAKLYTYQHVIVDLNDTASQKHAISLRSGDGEPGRAHPSKKAFDLIMNGNGTEGMETADVPPHAKQRGVAMNVSLAPMPAAGSKEVREIVIAPKEHQKLGDMLSAVGITDHEQARLAEALQRRDLQLGDSLELLLEEAGKGNPPHVVLARYRHGGAPHVVYGRSDDGSFRTTGSERLFARLSRDALLTAYSPEPAVDGHKLADGRHPQTSVRSRLISGGAPKDVVDDVMKLAQENGVALDGGAKSPDQIDLLFRKGDDEDPELVFVEFNTAGKHQRLYRHQPDGDEEPDYFDERGASVTKYLLHKPVANGKLGDGFAWRIHPVLKVKKHHNGVDFRAPMGSPIVAAGDGTVQLISYQKGYGKYVRIRHIGGYSTTYAHLSSAAPGLKVGQRVKQGEVIAYVGSTGYSTGPHLYYELRIGDRYVDPLSVNLQAGDRLSGDSLQGFQKQVEHVGRIVSEMELPSIDTAHDERQ